MCTKVPGAPTARALHAGGPYMVLGQRGSGAQLEEVHHHQDGFGLGWVFFVGGFLFLFFFKPVS